MPGSIRIGREALFAATLLAIVALCWFSIVRPWLNWREETSVEISEIVERIARFASVVSQGEGGGDRVRAEIEERFGPEFLRGESDAIILADLQSLIGEIVTRHGCELALSRQLPTRTEDGRTSLGLHLQIRGDVRRMFGVLHSLETGKPFLQIENASLRLMDGAAIAAQEGADIIQIIAELDIYGTRWPSGQGAGR